MAEFWFRLIFHSAVMRLGHCRSERLLLRRRRMKENFEANVWVSEDRIAVWIFLAIGAIGLMLLLATR